MGSSGPGANFPMLVQSSIASHPKSSIDLPVLSKSSPWLQTLAHTPCDTQWSRLYSIRFYVCTYANSGYLSVYSRVYSEKWDNTVRSIIAWILRSSPLFRAQIGEFKAEFKNG